MEGRLVNDILQMLRELGKSLDANQRAIIERGLKKAFDNSNNDWPRIFQSISENMADKRIGQLVNGFLDQ